MIRSNTFYIQTLYIPTNLLFYTAPKKNTFTSAKKTNHQAKKFFKQDPSNLSKSNQIYIKNFLTLCSHQCPASDCNHLSTHWIVVFVKKIVNIYLANTHPINNYYYTIIIYFSLPNNTYIICFIRNSIYK